MLEQYFLTLFDNCIDIRYFQFFFDIIITTSRPVTCDKSEDSNWYSIHFLFVI
jgi:hypothetical protein